MEIKIMIESYKKLTSKKIIIESSKEEIHLLFNEHNLPHLMGVQYLKDRPNLKIFLKNSPIQKLMNNPNLIDKIKSSTF